MSWKNIGAFQVDQATSCQFAQASGDFNPLHVDPILARRYQYGSTVIHGVCGILKALDILLMNLDRPVSLTAIKAHFTRPILHGDHVEVFSYQSTWHDQKLRLSVHGRRAQDITLVLTENGKGPEITKNAPISASKPQPVVLGFEDALGMESTFDLVWNPELMQILFPHAKQFLPDYQAAVLLGLTRIVGMKCPGLHSVFAGLNVHFVQNPSVSDVKMHFNVTKNDSRFSMITLGVTHNTANGEITALFRPKPVSQEKYIELQAIVPKNQFANQKALIIGGSRGIGEVTAKLIAAGGGHPVITYYRGKDDADRIVSDIRSHGGKCDAVSYDVLSPSKTVNMDCSADERVTHIYYFASPLIEKGEHLVWDDAVFQKFCNYYLSGFGQLIENFLSDSLYAKQKMTVFVPSTIFLDQPQKEFNEYIAAKAAVEALIRQLTVKLPNWKFMIPRLPRMLTDQTSGVNIDSSQKTAEVMLDALTSLDNPSD